ncbi:AMP-binding protein [Blastococcus tunisiensis]|uniref:Cyclohexanecarboxylate-CoA ligase n=1 Tax=Blastococcus tunisiensis TaxID=1798228 RepID=A0A1I2KMP3_9ACTN|nr:AMP-binding protein [Blastococcus sp. DSM 46838]SFF68244.1 cyclohexanecarboxylate-CoA ligase [Blastococcus sp. DSM 46838]
MRAHRLTPTTLDRYTRPGMWEDNFLDDYLHRAAAVDPDRSAVVDRGISWTYGELDQRVTKAANVLLAHGVERGDAVSWQLPNWVEAVVVHHAALRIGAVSNPIIPIYRHSEVRFILAQARSKVVVVPQSFRGFDFPGMIDELRPELPDLRHVLVVGTPEEIGERSFAVAVDGAADERVLLPRNPNDVALLLYTSGTTSSPKGTLHTHNTLDYETRSIIDLFELDGRDVAFMPSPVGHITGILYGMQLPFILGSTVVLLDTWEPGEGLRLIEQHGCSFLMAATPFLLGMVTHAELSQRDLSSLRVFACGGADVPPDLVRTATVDLNCLVTRIYGSTEFPTATSSSRVDPLERRAHTDGRAIGPAELRVVDQDGDTVPPGTPGELLLRGPDLFLGYLDATLDDDAFDDDGWFRTGDLVVLDEDGFVTITGRQKDIIIRGGENISAKDVEDHLFEHPAIADVAVVAVPDPVMGERVCAVVVPKAGAALELHDVTDWLRARRIAVQKLPERLVVVPELPRTASGKIQKFKICEQLRTGLDTQLLATADLVHR